MYFTGMHTWHDLELNACRDSLVSGCTFDDYRGTTEMLQLDYAGSTAQFPWFGPFDNTPCENITIERCVFDDPQVRIVNAMGNHMFLAGVVTKNIHIRNNLIKNCIYGVSFNDVEGLFITENVFDDTLIGIHFVEQQNNSKSWYLYRNKFYYLSGVIYGEGRMFLGETSTLTKGFSDVKIVGNVIDKAYFHGIGFTATKDVIISENTITNCGRNGIYVFGGSNIIVNNNTIHNIVALGEAGRADIVVGNSPTISDKVVVSGNYAGTIIVGSNIGTVLITNNFISTSITAGTGLVKNNVITGAWVAG